MDIPPYEEFLKQIKINLWLTGIPYGDPKMYLRFYILLCPLIIMMVTEISFFVSRISAENFLELTQLAPCICIGILSLLKIAAISQKRGKIYALTESLSQLYDHILVDSNKRQLVRHELVLVNMLMKYFFVLNAVLITVYNFSTLAMILYHYFTTNEIVFRLPYAVLLPFSTDAWIPWAGVYMHSVLCGFICVLYYTTVDGLYFVLTSHVCGNFRVISDMIGKLDATNVDTLGEIVKSHQYILKLGEDLEDIFTAPNLFNVLVGSLEICALGFNLTTGSWEQIPGSLLFIISVLLQILMMSVFGENIIRESTKVGDAAFLSNWYKMDTKSKKTILTIMIRSHKPQRLTAYKFSTISYGSFTKIISTSWSYFTILRTVYKPPEMNKSE
ncbi:putative odorant receptor 92a [Anticarsia gemmatalis]|uniref:putative odorant receptor 92a n=1 Tax=Anticarsia gemmatalis TaxID=129554 RepID=UPI003F761D08